jgi:hypothetical protein
MWNEKSFKRLMRGTKEPTFLLQLTKDEHQSMIGGEAEISVIIKKCLGSSAWQANGLLVK